MFSIIFVHSNTFLILLRPMPEEEIIFSDLFVSLRF